MDVVITYVNSSDPIWQAQYEAATSKPMMAKRYRDWGFMPYLFRGIERYMPFVEKVFLVVSTASQVPEWIDRERVQIVEHKDIIPQQFLPTFNSCTIELFLHRIEGLSEQFLYFNDDLFPINTIEKSDLFIEDKVVMHFAKHLLACGMYKKQCKASNDYVRKALNLGRGIFFVRPQHTITPMLRNEQQKIFSLVNLSSHITMLRRADNANQYLFSDYLYYTNRVINKRLSTKHCSMKVYDEKQIVQAIEGDTKIVCINDVEMPPQKEQLFKQAITQAFEKKFPIKSKFEL